MYALILALLLVVQAGSLAEPPARPIDALPGIESHLTDPARRLSEQERQVIDRNLGSLQADTQVDVAFYVTDRDEPILPLAKRCLEGWKIGKAWKGGVLLVVDRNLSECVLLMTNPDYPLPSKTAERIRERMASKLRSQALGSTLREAVVILRRELQVYSPQPVVHPAFEPNRARGLRYALGAAAVLILAGLSQFIRAKNRKESKPGDPA